MKKEKDPRGRKANTKRLAAMARLRERGWTWRRIGEKFHVTRQAASQAVKRSSK